MVVERLPVHHRQAARPTTAGRRPVLARVDPGADGLHVTPGTNLTGEPRDWVALRGCVPLRVAMTAPHVADVRCRESLLRAAALFGAVERTCQLTIEHVRVCTQFGRPLLAQQAVAHAVATMAGEREQSRAALRGALAAWGGDYAASRVAAARVVLGRAATTVARLAHQLHGAVGVTREHPLHRPVARLARRAGRHPRGVPYPGHGGRRRRRPVAVDRDRPDRELTCRPYRCVPPTIRACGC
ncbi:acyl-CoA dehydrogenase family protein [Solwaraspora sp. WMMA2065]|uniref:acyl-CoA dehydrogenase family protein n=1 Tax=Solwaraspora sp. WMMA2065 TaxID=3015166 RepID=UPI00259BEC86|nr:acyl-CoA dehydrogenase family protein [Solwaraspora sp. WMMA2065]WJK36133.1 acyl-CoA dehydrogenase family protein [Solwaraspora sp. WMMA2065]